jgi:hypothetical protein
MTADAKAVRAASAQGVDFNVYLHFPFSLTNFGGLSPQQDRQRVLCRGLSYKVAPLLPWRQPLPLGEWETLRAIAQR